MNRLDIEDIGERVNIGTAAVVGTAVYTATGTRIRDLPIAIDKLIERAPRTDD